VKDKDNPFFKKPYADLESVWDAARPLMEKHGLAVIQLIEGTSSEPEIITVLVHKSGQWVTGTQQMKSRKPDDPQVAGSLITYGRRYGLAAILGITQTDDDGNSGSGNKTDASNSRSPAPTADKYSKPKPTKSASDKTKTPIKQPAAKKSPDKPVKKAKEELNPEGDGFINDVRQEQIGSQYARLSDASKAKFLEEVGLEGIIDLDKLPSSRYMTAIKSVGKLWFDDNEGSADDKDDIPF